MYTLDYTAVISTTVLSNTWDLCPKRDRERERDRERVKERERESERELFYALPLFINFFGSRFL